MRRVTPEKISKLENNEVFVFGSNATGFHGAGAAGLACRGDAKNTWRSDEWFLQAMKSSPSSPNRIGLWAIYGVARGFQKGKEGSSYAIETIKVPGQKRSTPLLEIQKQIDELVNFALQNAEKIFLVTKIGSALAGYEIEEIKVLFQNNVSLPDNIILPQEYEFR